MLNVAIIHCMSDAKSIQLNVRVEGLVEEAIDAKRIELSRELRYIPSRSEIIRLALETYLGIQGGLEASQPSNSKEGVKEAAVKRGRGKT